MPGLEENVIVCSTDSFVHRMPFGAELEADGRVRFRVWAPEAATMRLQVERTGERVAMERDAEGWHALVTDAVRAGEGYRYVLPDGTLVPDPVSRFQPEDVNGPSMVVDPCRYTWRTSTWMGRPWEETVLYELHIGTFTEEGTFRAAEGRLAYLVELGVTAIEIMSVGDFPGRWNWGYDGVLLYAPDASYGTPEELKSLVDAAHGLNLMVVLDVVYNHFGPEGNYIPQYFPEIATDRYETPWGKALNYDAEQSAATRELVIQNALYWIEEFRMDGLRLDAVHAMMDASTTHVLDELARRVRTVAAARQVHLILESDDTMWVRLLRDAAMTPLLSTAQWNHDMRQLQVLGLTSGRPAEQDVHDTELLGRALIEGFTSSPPKVMEGAVAMELPEHLSPASFVSFLQTHDLVGNRPGGERVTHFAGPEVVRALASVYLLAPQVPMLFMGEEWGASSPFPFFCDFGGELGEAVRAGRLAQFSTAAQREDLAYVASLPDPLEETTFRSAKLRWAEREAPGVHAEMLDFYRRALRARREHIVPLLRQFPANTGMFEVLGPRSIEVSWCLEAGTLRLQANLCSGEAQFPERAEVELWMEGTRPRAGVLGPWTVRWTFCEAAVV